MTSTVLFDLDGTLIDTRRLYLECYRRAIEPHLERPPSREEILRLKPRSEMAFLRAVAGESAAQRCLEDFHAHYAALYHTHFDGIFGGVPELLGELRRRRLPLGVVTGKSRRSWSATAAVAELGRFEALVVEDDVAEPKPSPEGILLALRLMDAPAEGALYVGDTMGDVHASLEAGVHPVAALWSHPPDRRQRMEEAAREAGATLARHPSEVLGIVTARASTRRAG